MPNNRTAKAERDELKSLDAAALAAQRDAARRTLWENRFALGKRQFEKTAELSKLRKRIARIETYLRQTEQEETK